MNKSFTKRNLSNRGWHSSGFPATPPRSVILRGLVMIAVVCVLWLSGCGGGASNSGDPPPGSSIAGNWQFTMANPDPNYPTGTQYGLQGGFLVQANGKVSGQAVYSISGISASDQTTWAICDSGSAQLTGSTSGQTVTLTATTGSQSFALQGTLDSNGQISNGTFTTSGGSASGFMSCGLPASGQNWSAAAIPPLTGSITGSFHSGGSSAPPNEANQDFLVTGTFTQGPNIGAANATVIGTLSFIDPATGASDYSCVPSGRLSVNGQISGNTVLLQLIGTDGSNAGQIGVAPTQVGKLVSGSAPVTFDSTTNGYVLHSSGVGYVVNTGSCSNAKGGQDSGYVCLGLNSASACQQPIMLTPAALGFSAQTLGSSNPSNQTISVTNTSAQSLDNLSLTWNTSSGINSDTGQTDFTNLPNFVESDSCVQGGESLSPGETGSSFSLQPGQTCTITAGFTPQASCTWLPGPYGGASPGQCPFNLTAFVTVNNVASSADNNSSFTVPIKGKGLSFVQPSTPELDFGAEAFGEASVPQLLSFKNTAVTPVQILPYVGCKVPSTGGQVPLTHPLVNPPAPPSSEFPVVASGLQVVDFLIQDVNQSTILYNCDFDPTTQQANFQISSDTCSGALLPPQQSCSLQVTFNPQSPQTYSTNLDYFLELNTVQCTDPVNDPPSPGNPCELDGGRMAVELKANPTSPLRMTPAAGLDFGAVPVNTSSTSQSITLLNDPNLNPQVTVNFTGRIVVNGSYTETDDCPFSLSSGSSCTVVVTFKPTAKGSSPGTMNINYSVGAISGSQLIYMRGTGQ